MLEERAMQVGTARLLTGCIGAVVTYPDHRHQGVATALMHDALDYAQSHHYALLLLDGIPKFYYRYSYDDVFDVTVQDIDRAALLAQPPSELRLCPVTPEDAEYILALYNRHFGPLTGSFTRTVEWQQHRLQYRSTANPLAASLGSCGDPMGETRCHLKTLVKGSGSDHEKQWNVEITRSGAGGAAAVVWPCVCAPPLPARG
jgi:predicted acetyltransferase